MVHPALALGDHLLSGVEWSIAVCMAAATSPTYLSNAGFDLGHRSGGSSRVSLVRNTFSSMLDQSCVSTSGRCIVLRSSVVVIGRWSELWSMLGSALQVMTLSTRS